MSRLTCLAVGLTVVAAHFWLQLALGTQEWAWHPRTTVWEVSAALSTVALVLALGRRWPVTIGLLAGATAANGLSSVAFGAVPNYWVTTGGGEWLAFNLPDVLLITCGTAAVGLVARDAVRRRRGVRSLTDA